MRLTLDLTPTLLRSAGVRNHLFYWTSALQASRAGHELEFFPSLSQLPALHHDQGLETGIPDWRLLLVFALNNRFAHFPAKFLSRAGDVFHGSPQLRRAPRTRRLTSHIHDLTCWFMPELHTRANVAAAKEAAEHVWKQADGLIAVSNSARNDAIETLALDPARIQVIYHGVPEAFFAVTTGEIARVRTAFHLERPYVLHVGTVEPRKNLDRLLNAWKALGQGIHREFDLVVAGPAGWQAQQTLARLRSGEPGVRYLGYVAESDLPGLTAGATINAYPSLYEGFGFPLAQAMVCGIPSVTSNVSSMPEVSAGSAQLIDPRSENELRDALFRLLTSPDLRRSLGEQGRIHALANYRWPQIARQSWDFFERIAA